MQFRKALPFLISVVLIGFWSCRRSPTLPEWDADFFGPLLKADMGINNLIPDSLITSNPDNSLNLVYESTIYELIADSLFKIPDTTLNYSYLVPAGWVVVTPGSQILNNTGNNQYQLGGAQIKRAVIRNGYMDVLVTNTIHKRLLVQFSMPLTTKNSQPFNKTVVVPAAVGNNPGIFTDTFRLDGYSVDLRGPNGNSYNTLVSSVVGSIHPNEVGVDTVYQGEGVVINLSFKKMVPQYATGYFGQSTHYIGPEETGFDLFRKIVGGSLHLESATMDLNIENGFGVDARVRLSELTSRNTNTGNNVTLNHSIINSTININRATDPGGQVQPSIYSVTLNNQNSNLKSLLENLPNKLRYALFAEINPLGNVSGSNDFAYYGKGLKINGKLEVPLSLGANGLTFVDTVSFSIGDPEKNPVLSGQMFLYAENGFPLDCEVSLGLLDGNGNLLSEFLPVSSVIDEAPLGSNGIVSSPRLTKLIIPVPEWKIAHVNAAKKVVIKAKFTTTNAPAYLKIYSHYKLKLKVVGDFKTRIKAS
jgi:hypothetical protein